MPNWVRNEINVRGTREDLSAMLEFVREGDLAFSFNKLIPMPESLHIVSGSSLKPCMIAYALHLDTPLEDRIGALSRAFHDDILARLGIKSEPKEQQIIKRVSEALDLMQKTAGHVGRDVVFDGSTWPDDTFDSHAKYGKAYYENYKNYGSETWYEWRCDKWGCKWNCCEIEIGDILDEPDVNGLPAKVTITFDTPWSMPEGVLTELIIRFPSLHFEGLWADEDIGSNCGSWAGMDGALTMIMPQTEEASMRFACSIWGYDADEYLADRFGCGNGSENEYPEG